MIFFECGIPKAVAIVSPVNDGSRTTNPPWTPLSVNKLYGIIHSRQYKTKYHQSSYRLQVKPTNWMTSMHGLSDNDPRRFAVNHFSYT